MIKPENDVVMEIDEAENEVNEVSRTVSEYDGD